MWKTDTVLKKEAEAMPGPGEYNPHPSKSKSMSCFHSGPDRFGRTKIREDRKPGPGAYNVGSSSKTSYNATTEGYFNSKSSRFPKDPTTDSGGPGMYF